MGLLLALGLGTGPQAPAAAGEDAGGSLGLGTVLQPAVSNGDFEFALDARAVQAVPGGGRVEVLVQLPVRAFLVQTQADRAELRLRVRVYGASAALAEAAGAPLMPGTDSLRDRTASGEAALETELARFEGLQAVAEAETRTVIEAADRETLRDTDFRLLELALEVPAGDHVVQVVAENLSRKKRGLLDRLRRRPLAATARLLVRVPDFAREPVLTDPGFEFGHGVHSPSPARLFGLLSDSLHVRATLFAHGTYLVRATATDRDGQEVWRDSLQVDAAGARQFSLHTSVNTFAAGQYLLRVAATGPQGRAVAARGFDVAWSIVTWTSARRDLDTEAELALGEEAYAEYRTLPVGEKERYLEAFWHGLDPTPDTAQNEVRDEFLRRVAYADLHYSEGVRGSRTDRGLVYLHFGPPDEQVAEAVPAHLAGQGGEEALGKVDDAFLPAEHPATSTLEPSLQASDRTEDPRNRAAKESQEHRAVIGQANEVAGYELWVYTGGGQGLFPEDRAMTFDTGLRLIFVDLQGYGRYRLRKSSVRLNIHGLSQSY